MKTVTIRTSALLAKVKANREKHAAEHALLMAKYAQAIEREATRLAEDARAGRAIDLKQITRIPRPTDHTDDYDGAIAMLEMTSSEVVELEVEDFDSYVRDKWHWDGAFSATKGFYGLK